MIKGTDIELINHPYLTGGYCNTVTFMTKMTNRLREGRIIELEGDAVGGLFLNKEMIITSIKKVDGCNQVYCKVLTAKPLSTTHYQQDTINPDHHKHGDIETIDYITAINKNMKPEHAFFVGNAIKYLSRFPKKNGLEDVKKAQWYVNKLIEIMEAE